MHIQLMGAFDSNLFNDANDHFGKCSYKICFEFEKHNHKTNCVHRTL